MKTLLKKERKRNSGELAEFLKQARKDKDLSLSELSDLTGISRSYLGELETGAKGYNLPMHTVAMLSQALDVSPAAINAKMEGNTEIDARKYGEHYKVLRSGVRAVRIAQLLDKIRADCKRAKTGLIHGWNVAKILQDIEKTVEAVDRTLAYRGKPPACNQHVGESGDEEKFIGNG